MSGGPIARPQARPRARRPVAGARLAGAARVGAVLVAWSALPAASQTAAHSPPQPPQAPARTSEHTAARGTRPLWELGLGVAGLQMPHYRGSDQRYSLALPLPYAVYRGSVFRADRDGTRAVLLDRDRLELDLSVAAGTPTNSRDNQARAGMADLGPTFEFGPKLNWTLARSPALGRLDLRLPLRTVLEWRGGLHPIGWTFTPHLNLDLPVRDGWQMGLLARLQVADRRYNAHFYEVGNADATAGRPAWRAPAGYAGYDLLAALSHRSGPRWMGAFVRWDDFAGSALAASPLVRQRRQWSAGLAMSWVIWTSAQQVTWPE